MGLRGEAYLSAEPTNRLVGFNTTGEISRG
jgi:hypothetical protein